jgi:hypothetical protein
LFLEAGGSPLLRNAICLVADEAFLEEWREIVDDTVPRQASWGSAASKSIANPASIDWQSSAGVLRRRLKTQSLSCRMDPDNSWLVDRRPE